ncbi:Caffeine-induced protein 16 [Zancudomyces culisetae]|uniref:polynucleotide adenylyltransferase n=1 Tax=Zancudomyces culisetae TaxID=1213189 RepID=A0A1R1PQY9_ZANCU|nr:Caffeine-induced protein 16 [Zancudomyces culisetae]|eukprot:OMH83351.1 Caffeine-induced protein 16 [Zancudomyces culisetae]
MVKYIEKTYPKSVILRTDIESIGDNKYCIIEPSEEEKGDLLLYSQYQRVVNQIKKKEKTEKTIEEELATLGDSDVTVVELLQSDLVKTKEKLVSLKGIKEDILSSKGEVIEKVKKRAANSAAADVKRYVPLSILNAYLHFYCKELFAGKKRLKAGKLLKSIEKVDNRIETVSIIHQSEQNQTCYQAYMGVTFADKDISLVEHEFEKINLSNPIETRKGGGMVYETAISEGYTGASIEAANIKARDKFAKSIKYQIDAILKEHEPDTSYIDHTRCFCAKVINVIDAFFKGVPNYKTELVGSYKLNLNIKNSDIDLVLLVRDSKCEDLLLEDGVLIELARVISEAFVNNECRAILVQARIPVIKVKYSIASQHDVLMDICVNNVESITKTRYLQEVSSRDHRVYTLLKLVKIWAYNRGLVCGAALINTFTFSMMLLAYLFETRAVKTVDINSFNDKNLFEKTLDAGPNIDLQLHLASTFWDENQNPMNTKHKHVAFLLLGFFEYYGYIHDYERHAIVPSLGTTKHLHENAINVKNFASLDAFIKGFKPLFIFDPIDTNLNLGRNLSFWSFEELKMEFRRAYHILNCQQYSASQTSLRCLLGYCDSKKSYPTEFWTEECKPSLVKLLDHL